MKTFGCLCCESGPLNMKVTLNKNGFVPGEYIDIKAEVKLMINYLLNECWKKKRKLSRHLETFNFEVSIYLQVNNKSNKRIGGVYIVFYQYLVYHANGKKKKDNECVVFQMRYMILNVWIIF